MKYILPKEIIEGFVTLGYDRDDVSDVDNIDLGFYCKDGISGTYIVTYACYTDEEGSEDVVEVTVDCDTCFIAVNGEEVFRADCTYDIDSKNEIPIGTLHIVD